MTFIQKEFPYGAQMEHLEVCTGVVECKFCGKSSQIIDDHKNECVEYLQNKLQKMEDLLKKNEQALKEKQRMMNIYLNY